MKSSGSRSYLRGGGGGGGGWGGGVAHCSNHASHFHGTFCQDKALHITAAAATPRSKHDRVKKRSGKQPQKDTERSFELTDCKDNNRFLAVPAVWGYQTFSSRGLCGGRLSAAGIVKGQTFGSKACEGADFQQ